VIRFEYHQPTSLVVRYAAAYDIGYAVNPTLAEGQIHGGVA
jgi:CO/xanthine dehydrogenase Mo-binding subunit